MRFKCVCKFFLTLISSPEFVDLHSINYHSSEEEVDRTLFVSGNDSRLYSFSINSLQSTSVQFPLLGIFPRRVEGGIIEVIGSCKGLLCLASICPDAHQVRSVNCLILLNPFTRNYKEISLHHLPGKIGSLGLGFGFDDVNQDYKIVSVTECIHSSCRLYVVVFSLASNTWKFIEHGISSRDYMEPKSWSVLINNHLLHWLFFGDNGFRIGCFDLRTDKWISDVPAPEPCNDGSQFGYFGQIPVCLRKLGDGCLCFCDQRSPKFLDLWVMREYGVKDSWVLYRLSMVNFPKELIDPVAFNEDEILVKQRNATNLIFVYNIKRKSVRKIQVDGVAPFLQAYECKESLSMTPMATLTLPMDIIRTCLLPRLPTKTLMRFKCVCKFFLTLISSPEFIDLHFNYYHSFSEVDHTLFVSGNDSCLYSFSINSLQSTPVQFPLLGMFPRVKGDTIEVIGSCKGLLCLASICPNNHQVRSVNCLMLLNPFTRNYKEISLHEFPGKIGSLGLGFGFDDLNQDYKIVSVTECVRSGCRLYVVVYSLASNTWTFIEHGISSRDYMEPKSWCVLINNHLLHWLFFGDNGFRIGCFDLRTDKWISDVPSPEPCNDGSGFGYFGHIPVCLRKMGDSCLCFCDQRSPKNVDLWVMREYGVKDSWVLYRLSMTNSPKKGLMDPVALNEDEMLLKQRNVTNLIFVYNIKRKSVRKIEVDGVAPFLQAYECRESLAMIPTSAQTGPAQTVGLDDLPMQVVTLPSWYFN